MNRRASMLHLLIGQEVIYMVMAASLCAAIVMAIWATRLEDALSRERARETPPIINLTETSNCHFASGSAALSPCFETKLNDTIAPLLHSYSRTYSATIVEVIGHTDEQPIHPAPSTIDQDLLGFMRCEPSANPELVAADNAGLGMARAASVACALRHNPLMQGLTILPYSAGQAILPNDSLANGDASPAPDQSRRRIEIRLRRRLNAN